MGGIDSQLTLTITNKWSKINWKCPCHDNVTSHFRSLYAVCDTHSKINVAERYLWNELLLTHLTLLPTAQQKKLEGRPRIWIFAFTHNHNSLPLRPQSLAINNILPASFVRFRLSHCGSIDTVDNRLCARNWPYRDFFTSRMTLSMPLGIGGCEIHSLTQFR